MKKKDTDSARASTCAIALQPKFPIPNRTKQPIRSAKDEDGVIDIGWCEGAMSDGRPFRAEMWAQDQVSMLTIFFSTIGIEELDQEGLRKLVEQEERLVRFKEGVRQNCESRKFTDDAGKEVWSVNIVIGDENNTFVSDSVPIFPYSKTGEPNSMLNPVPIKAAHAKGGSKAETPM